MTDRGAYVVKMKLEFDERDANDAPGGSEVGASMHAAPIAHDPCVLVVDDNPVNQMVAAEMLSCWGIAPVLACDGGEAVALACGLSPDLVLMDLQMPILDGIAATRQIRRFERDHGRARMPIVAYTSSPLGIGPGSLRDGGLDGVLAKPCDRKALHECLLRWGVPGIPAQTAAALGASRPGVRFTMLR